MPPRKMTDEKLKFLIDNYGKLTTREIAEKIDLTPERVCYYARMNGLSFEKAKRYERSKITPEMLKYIEKNALKMSYNKIADDLGVSKTAVSFHAARMGFRKNNQFKTAPEPYYPTRRKYDPEKTYKIKQPSRHGSGGEMDTYKYLYDTPNLHIFRCARTGRIETFQLSRVGIDILIKEVKHG